MDLFSPPFPPQTYAVYVHMPQLYDYNNET